MKSVILCLSFLLFNFYPSEVALIIYSNNGHSLSPEYIFKHHDLDLGELLHLAETNSTPISILNEKFRQRYSSYWINVDKNIDVREKYKEFKDQKLIIIYDQKTALETLKYFGGSIKKLDIENSEVTSFPMVAKYANQYASESLTHLKMHFLWNETFSPFEKPFNRIESLEFFYIQPIKSDKTFRELFPNLQEFLVIFVSDVDFSYINCGMPKLRKLTIFRFPYVIKHLNQIQFFLEKNPQIGDVESDQVRLIKAFLPHLENLTIADFDIGYDTVCFERVKNLIVEMRSLKSLKQLIFPQLETLEMEYIPEDVSTHVYLFKQYRHLKKLNFVATALFDDITLLEKLLAELTDLIEIKLSTNADITVDFISILIQSHNRLTRIEHLAHNLDIVNIRKRFENEWHIKEFEPSEGYYEKGLLMEKMENAIAE